MAGERPPASELIEMLPTSFRFGEEITNLAILGETPDAPAKELLLAQTAFIDLVGPAIDNREIEDAEIVTADAILMGSSETRPFVHIAAAVHRLGAYQALQPGASLIKSSSRIVRKEDVPAGMTWWHSSDEYHHSYHPYLSGVLESAPRTIYQGTRGYQRSMGALGLQYKFVDGRQVDEPVWNQHSQIVGEEETAAVIRQWAEERMGEMPRPGYEYTLWGDREKLATISREFEALSGLSMEHPEVEALKSYAIQIAEKCLTMPRGSKTFVDDPEGAEWYRSYDNARTFLPWILPHIRFVGEDAFQDFVLHFVDDQHFGDYDKLAEIVALTEVPNWDKASEFERQVALDKATKMIDGMRVVPSDKIS